jgi:hypothetical protein
VWQGFGNRGLCVKALGALAAALYPVTKANGIPSETRRGSILVRDREAIIKTGLPL